MHSLILGKTPLRTVSKRRLLFTPRNPSETFSTPAPTATTPAVTLTRPVTINERAGTIVTHVVINGNPRSGQQGVIVSKTAGDTTKLDVLWTGDGQIEAVLPSSMVTISTDTPITIDTSKGTLVKHKVAAGNSRSEHVGAVMGKAATDAAKLSILWTSDGKVMKGPNYRRPDLKQFLD